MTDNSYYSYIWKSLLDLIPIENREGRILEIGAGDCSTLLYAKEHHYTNEIYGVELCKIQNKNQQSAKFDDFIIGNIETITLPFQKEYFDVILCGDVLEHLIDPWRTLENLKLFLKEEGVLVASIPNIREWNTIKQIFFKGDFKYQDAGILDRTHLRFFCKKNMINLFEDTGYIIKDIHKKWYHSGGNIFILNKVLPRLFEQFMVGQYIFLVKKAKE